MANRAMAAKVERAARERRELAAAEFSKPFYQGNMTLSAGEAVSRSVGDMVAVFLANGGKVRRIPCTGKAPRFSKSGCDPRTRSLWNGEAERTRAVIRHAAAESRLIPAR